MYKFITPSVEEGPAGVGPLFSRYRLNRGVSVLKVDNQWYEMRYPTEEDLVNAQYFYRGGYEYTVDDTVGAELLALGYNLTAL